VCSFVFHRIGAEATHVAAHHAQSMMQALEAPVEQHWQHRMGTGYDSSPEGCGQPSSQISPYTISPHASPTRDGSAGQRPNHVDNPPPRTLLDPADSTFETNWANTSTGEGVGQGVYAPPLAHDEIVGGETWEKHRTPEGEVYYYNPGTHETSWDKPRAEPNEDKVSRAHLSGEQDAEVVDTFAEVASGPTEEDYAEYSEADTSPPNEEEDSSPSESPSDNKTSPAQEAKIAAQLKLSARTAEMTRQKAQIMNPDAPGHLSPRASAAERQPKGMEGVLGTRIEATLVKPFGMSLIISLDLF
jgi:hypothetical protein